MLTHPLVINPNAVYREGDLALAFDIRLAALARARREGRLRFKREGHAVLILGQWVIDWLTDNSPRSPLAAKEVCHAK